MSNFPFKKSFMKGIPYNHPVLDLELLFRQPLKLLFSIMYISKTAFVALALSFSIASAAPAPPISQANTVLVPLYIYPTPGAWDPLYQA